MLDSKDVSIIVVLSTLGGTTSVVIGYVGRFVSQIPLLSFVGGQLLSGAHILWLILAAVMVRGRESASMTGALKGLVEVGLFSHITIFAFFVSLIQGFIVDVVFVILRKTDASSRYIAAGFSSASNIIVIYFFLFPRIQIEMYFLMYLASFLSGLMFGGYLTSRILKILNLRGRLPTVLMPS